MTPTYTPYHGTYLGHRISLEGRSEDAFTRSLSTARVETKPHQIDAALFALHSPLSKGVILADEVGLGKTIEASLVIAQFWAERRRRVLIVVPASLRKQWQQELKEKFALPSQIVEAKTWDQIQKNGNLNPFDAADKIIVVSYEFAARRADEIRRVQWDMIVFDEAHRLRNVYKKSGSQRAKALSKAVSDRFKILLTATPLQNSLMELFGLVSIIDHQFFGDEQTFKAMYDGRQADPHALSSLRRRMKPIYKRHLRREVQEAGHVSFTRRMATTFDFEPSEREVELYDKVSAYLQRPNSIAFGLRPNQLVIIQARKILGSSVAAIAGFLETVRDRLLRQDVADISTVADVDNTDQFYDEMADSEALDELTPAVRKQRARKATKNESNRSREIDSIKLKAEISEITSYIALARAIGPTEKGAKLVARLPEVFAEVAQRGGERKVVIFTESVRTQKYLAALLADNGYLDQIVLLNGSNSDVESQALYKAWCERNQGTEAISGSRSSDMKAAVVEAFRSPEKSILISTESGAEGINLQFCSVVLNFDLPWNPQRVEQRIGRCHRYGQKIDVTVVNMLNRRNMAERRVFELLDEKFKLFSGVFGASDDVLGIIESGVDFERKVVEAVQRGRTEAEVEAEFKFIEEELQARLTIDMTEARRKVFANLDRDVVARLRQRGDDIQTSLDAFEHRLLSIVKAEMPSAQFPVASGRHFHFDGRTWSTEWACADQRGWQFFRLGENTLADQMVNNARARSLESAFLTFDYTAYRENGFARLSSVERLLNRSGWLSVSILSLRPVNPEHGNRDRLVIAGFTDDDGNELQLDQDTVDDLFLLPAVLMGPAALQPAHKIADFEESAHATVMAQVEEESKRWLNEEMEKLDSYADDLGEAAELRIKELDMKIKAARKVAQGIRGISLTEQITEHLRISELEAKTDEVKLAVFQRKKEIRNEINHKLVILASSLQGTPQTSRVFTIKWRVTE